MGWHRRWLGWIALVCASALLVAACGDDGGGARVDEAPSTEADASESPDTAALAAVRIVDAAVERLPDGRLNIEWRLDGDGEVAVSWGTDPDAPDEPLAVVTDGHELLVDDPSDGGRPYFRLVTDGDARTVAERRIVLEGQSNFRDLGGYETEDGRRVRWGRLYRSGELGELTEGDLAFLVDELGIRLVCDLRSAEEVAKLPDPAIAGVERVEIPVIDDSTDPVAIEEAILAGDLSVVHADLLVQANRSFVLDFSEEYAALMHRVTDPDSWPTNLHCTAGKDRAGWGSALVLFALGVPEQTVMDDYLLSSVYRAEQNAETVETVRGVVSAVRGIEPEELPDEELDGLRAVLDVRPEFLQAALDTVAEVHGDVETYLTEGLGLDREALEAFRDAMLEP